MIKQALINLFEDDCSSARPDGSIEVLKVYWWKHNCASGQHSSATVHRTPKIELRAGITKAKDVDDYVISRDKLDDLVPDELLGR